MSSDESDYEAPLQRVSSVNEKSLWDTVPGEIDLKLTIKKKTGKKSVRFLYTLQSFLISKNQLPSLKAYSQRFKGQ